MNLSLILLELPVVVSWILVVFMYLFTLALSLLVVGVAAQHLRLPEKMPSRQVNYLIFGLAITIYIGIVFLLLNDWAAIMLG
jgi:hypothetical protein